MTWLNNLFGEKKMSALTAGTTGPKLRTPRHGRIQAFSLPEALTRGPVLAIFFKVSCPVCQYAFPYFERMYKTYGGKQLTIVGISQNDKQRHRRIPEKISASHSPSSSTTPKPTPPPTPTD